MVVLPPLRQVFRSAEGWTHYRTHPQVSLVREVNVVNGASNVPTAQCQVAVTADNVDRFILTAYVPLDRDALNSSTAKTWMAAKDIATAAPHTNLLSN